MCNKCLLTIENIVGGCGLLRCLLSELSSEALVAAPLVARTNGEEEAILGGGREGGREGKEI